MKKFRIGKKNKQHDAFSDGETTQCGSQVPLFTSGRASDASVATSVIKPTTVPIPKRKRSLLGRMKRSRSSSQKVTKLPSPPEDDESWVQPWPDVSMEAPTESTVSTKQSMEEKQQDSPQRSVGGVSIPVAAHFPFGDTSNNAGDVLISSWLNDATSPVVAGEEETDNMDRATLTSVDDNSTLSSRGTGGSLYTYATGFFTTEASSYATPSTYLRSKSEPEDSSHYMTDSTDCNSIAYSHSSISAPSSFRKEEIRRSANERITMYERVVPESETEDKAVKDNGCKDPSIGEVMSDIGVVAEEIFHDVRESVSCMVDTTADTAKSSNCV